jgi:type II secretory pathway pseudopilin PulG
VRRQEPAHVRRDAVLEPPPGACGDGGFRKGDDGIVLLGVVGAMLILATFLLTMVAYTVASVPAARRDQDAKTAVAAAEAGLEEYLARLDADANYWKNGNLDPANPALQDPSQRAPAGRVIPGTGTAGARYRYSLLTTPAQTAKSGIIRLKVTGSTPGTGGNPVERTLTASLTPKGFLGFIYLSDAEVTDPDLVGGKAICKNYYYPYGGQPSRGSGNGCAEIQWTGGDTVRGPLHSNDALQINGLVNFTDSRTESSWPALNVATPPAQTWWTTTGQGPPLAGFAPKYAAPLALPAGNSELLKQVEPDVDGDGAVGPGCYYAGATRITFQGTSMRVYSPSTTRTGTPSRCLDVANRGVEQTKPIPPVIYVDGTTNSCTLGTVGYPRSGEQYTVGSSTAPSWASFSGTATTNYDCSRGSVYAQGTVTGQVTVAARDDVVVTDDLTLAAGTTGTDVVGLVAGNYVWVYHPVNSSGANLSGAPVVNDLQAAVLSLRHSFVVQNWSKGTPLGTLNVTGAIAQKLRGPVGTGSSTSIASGYYKNYVYDSRLSVMQPPYFLTPDSSPWQVSALTDK